MKIVNGYKIKPEADLRGADLQRADLRDADLRGADLQGADLRDANLRGADLREADLRDADLWGADLRGADLQRANLDFSSFPLWCGSFDMVDNGRIAKQLLSHIARLDIRDKELKAWVKKIPKKYKNDICKRHDVKEV